MGLKDRNAYIDLLGMTGEDKVTGFLGVITSVSFDLYGCVQLALTPAVDEKGGILDGRWLDANRIEIQDVPRVMPVPSFAAKPAEHNYGPAEKGRPR